MVPFGNWQLTSDHCLFDAHKVIAQYYFDIYLSLSVVVQRAHKIGRIPCSMDKLKKLGEDIGDTGDIYDAGDGADGDDDV